MVWTENQPVLEKKKEKKMAKITAVAVRSWRNEAHEIFIESDWATVKVFAEAH